MVGRPNGMVFIDAMESEESVQERRTVMMRNPPEVKTRLGFLGSIYPFFGALNR